MATRLGRTAILGIKPRTMDITDIPGWEGFITIKELSATDVETITGLRGKKGGATDLSVQYMISTIIGDDGKRLFNKDDASELRELGYEAITYITEEILKFSGLLDDEDYGSWSMPDLRKELESRQLDPKGRKTALLERLSADDAKNSGDVGEA